MTLSNSQGLMFAEISAQETKELQASTLTGWFGAQQTGQAKATITDAVNACRGVVTHTVGEAILSSFPDAKQAVKAAVEVKRRLAKAQSPTAGSVVKVRIGLAFGPVRVIAGRVSGDAVQAAGMLLEKAKPGEILVSQAVKDALGASSDVKMLPHGKFDSITVYRIADDAGAAPDPQLARTQEVQPRPDLTPPPKPTAPPAAAAPAAAPKPAPVAVPVPVPAPKPAPAAAPAPKPAPAAAPAPAVAPAPAASARGGTLVLQYAGGTEKRFSSKDGEISIGRAVENQVSVQVTHVSRKHAKIVWEGDTPYLVNLSQNGTCVQFEASGRQQPCEERTALQGSGAFALADRFGHSPTNADVVKFSIAAK